MGALEAAEHVSSSIASLEPQAVESGGATEPSTTAGALMSSVMKGDNVSADDNNGSIIGTCCVFIARADDDDTDD